MEFQVSTPCPKTWEELVGNDRVRYCGQCSLNVYNLTLMSSAEIERLVHKTGGRLCGQLYIRKDQTATLRDCPTGRDSRVRRRIRKTAAVLGAVIFGLVCRSLERPDLSLWPRWIQSVAQWVDPLGFPHRQRTMGAIRCVSPPAPVSPASLPPATQGS